LRDLIKCAGSEVQCSVVHLPQLGIWNLIIYQMTQRKVYTLKSHFSYSSYNLNKWIK